MAPIGWVPTSVPRNSHKAANRPRVYEKRKPASGWALARLHLIHPRGAQRATAIALVTRVRNACAPLLRHAATTSHTVVVYYEYVPVRWYYILVLEYSYVLSTRVHTSTTANTRVYIHMIYII